MSGQPQTEAGRALRDDAEYHEKGCPRWYMVDGSGSCDCQLPAHIARIERQAVAAYLASPQAAEELARAGIEHKHAMDERGVIHRCRWRNSDCAEAILAALRDQRGAS